ncbi:MAG: hypothetical protein ACYTEU_09070 [Planctomycetota bacterium]|jgi:hypothetical protein
MMKQKKLSWSMLLVLIAWFLGGYIWLVFFGLFGGVIAAVCCFWISVFVSFTAFVQGLIEVNLPQYSWKMKIIALVSIFLSSTYFVMIFSTIDRIRF